MTVEAPAEVAAQDAASPKKPAPAKVAEEIPASKEPTAEVAEKEPTPVERKALGALPALLSAGESALAAENFAEAVEKLSEASKLLANAYGPLSPKCAKTLLKYGRALFRLAAQQKNASTGAGDASTGAATGEAEPDKDAPAESKPNAEREEKACEEQEEESEEEEEAGEDEEKEDLQNAFEILDTARIILAKMEGDAAEKMLTEAHMLLGDVSLEGQIFTRAVSDFSSALEMAMKVYPPTDRAIAYVHFKLANALEWDNSRDKAVGEVDKAIEVLKLRAKLLASGEVKVANDKDAEIKEIMELIPDLEAKIKELKEAPLVDTLAAEDSLAGTAADMMKSRKTDAAEFLAHRLAHSDAANTPSAGSVKRKAEQLPNEDEDVKKMKEASSRED